MSRSMIGALALGPLLLAGLVACGGDSNGAASGDEAETTEDQGVQFAQCMREHGIDMPDPDPDTGRVTIGQGAGERTEEEFDAALAACEEYAPFGNEEDREAALNDPELQEALLDFAECMRENGVDMEDPTAGQGGLMILREQADDPDFEAAMEECQPILSDVFPEGRAGGGPGGGGNA